MAIQELLKTTEAWFSTSYPLDMEDESWKKIGKIVYKVDVNMLNSIIVDGGYILGNNIIKKLVQFVQLVTRFNQYVDMRINFVNSNFDKLKDNDGDNHRIMAYDLMKKLHAHGIGTNSCHNDPSDFPFLNKCFHDLNSIISAEINKKTKVLYWNKFIIIDFIIYFLITIGCILFLLLNPGI